MNVVQPLGDGWDQFIEGNLQVNPKISGQYGTRELPQGRGITEVNGVGMGGVFASFYDEMGFQRWVEGAKFSKVRFAVLVTVSWVHVFVDRRRDSGHHSKVMTSQTSQVTCKANKADKDLFPRTG